MGRLSMTSLQRRTLSALLMAPCFLAVVWAGGVYFAATLFILFFLSMFEWYGLVSKLSHARTLFLLGGAAYIAVSFYSFYLCRELDFWAIIMLLFMVWASDIGAYFSGKLVGGPKLLPQVSPNKTWAGMCGAALSPVLVLFAFCYADSGMTIFFEGYVFALLVLIGVLIGVIGQGGDLLMSFVKRQAGVKDTGRLIPGHGGVLDRIDSLLLVTPVFYVLGKAFLVITAAT